MYKRQAQNLIWGGCTAAGGSLPQLGRSGKVSEKTTAETCPDYTAKMCIRDRGQGDTYTLSTSLLTAFDTTIAGLVAAALAIVVSAIRRRWYREYGSVLEALCTEVLELTKKGEAR